MLAAGARTLLLVISVPFMGFLLGKLGRLSPSTLPSLALYVFTPCLVFLSLTKSTLASAEIRQIATFARLRWPSQGSSH